LETAARDFINEAKLAGQYDERQNRIDKLATLHTLAQRFATLEVSFKEMERRVMLLLRAIEDLRSIPDRVDAWQAGRAKRVNTTMGGEPHPKDVIDFSTPCGIEISTLDREQQQLETFKLLCEHLKEWAQCYKERANNQIQLVSQHQGNLPSTYPKIS
jgi:hypothetical protein